MTVVYRKTDIKPKLSESDRAALRPTLIFDMDYDIVDEKGNKIGPSFTVTFEADGEAWGSNYEETYDIRTVEEAIAYLQGEVGGESVFDPTGENFRRPKTVADLLEEWEFRPVPACTEIRIRGKENQNG
jgi:hypothetical protein